MALASLAVSSAFAVDYYNDLGDTNPQVGYGDWDGGVNQLGGNYGLQTGQVFTAGGNNVSAVEGYFIGFTNTPNFTGALVQIFNFSGGVVGSMVGQQQVSGSAVSLGGDPVFTGYYRIDVTANVNITGLSSGQQYLAVLQGQGADWHYLLANLDGNADSYGRDYSSFGYQGGYGTTTWTDQNTLNGYGEGDTLMRISGAVPEPASIAALGIGALGLFIRRRRRA